MHRREFLTESGGLGYLSVVGSAGVTTTSGSAGLLAAVNGASASATLAVESVRETATATGELVDLLVTVAGNAAYAGLDEDAVEVRVNLATATPERHELIYHTTYRTATEEYLGLRAGERSFRVDGHSLFDHSAWTAGDFVEDDEVLERTLQFDLQIQVRGIGGEELLVAYDRDTVTDEFDPE